LDGGSRREGESKIHWRCILEKIYKIDEDQHARKVLGAKYYIELTTNE
jgi:hypothetical protein